MRKHYIEICTVITGAVIMILELTGSRILSPYLGNSLIIWTSLIGIIFAFLSLGYYLGGRLADQKATTENLSQIVITAATLIAISTIIKENFLQILTNTISDPRASSIIATTVLFGPANIFLGMISPYCAKLKLHALSNAGAAVGSLAALSTIGSIIGTFLGGFYLLAFFGNTKLLLILSFILGLLSIFIDNRKRLKLKITILLIISLKFIDLQLLPAGANSAEGISLDTKYNSVLIKDDHSKENGLPIRIMWLGKNANSGIYLEGKSDELLFKYTGFYELAFKINPALSNTLMLGGGAFVYPQHFLSNHPNSKIDVVEIDDQFPEIAKKYFGLKENPNLKVISTDGRGFLNQNTKKYDAIFGDAFHGYYSIPYELTTQEAMQKISDSLTEKGLVIINIISAIEGPKSKFLKAEHRTIKSVFPQTILLQVKPETPSTRPQNLIIIALKTPASPDIIDNLPGLWTKPLTEDIEILTDDFAPVDSYMLELLNKS